MHNTLSRRAVLASGLGGLGLITGLAPRAHADADLEADVTVTFHRSGSLAVH